MSAAETQLAHALRARLALIADEESRRDAQSHMERLRQISEHITELSAELPQPVDPRLKHYLDRGSFSKALEFLEQASSRP
jgi:hypothetical protein